MFLPVFVAVFFFCSASGQTNDWEPLFSHTYPHESLGALPLTSQRPCLCTVLLCHGRLVPLGSAPANPSLSLLGAGPVFSQGSLFISPTPAPTTTTTAAAAPQAQPHSLSGCHSRSPHTHQIPWPSSVKTSRQKKKRLPASF